MYPLPYITIGVSRPSRRIHSARTRFHIIQSQLLLLITNLVIHGLNVMNQQSISLNFHSTVANTVYYLHTINIEQLHSVGVHQHALSTIYNRVSFIYRSVIRDRLQCQSDQGADRNDQHVSFSYILYIMTELATHTNLPEQVRWNDRHHRYHRKSRIRYGDMPYNQQSVPFDSSFYTTVSHEGAIPLVSSKVSLPAITDAVSTIELSSVLPTSISNHYYNVSSLLRPAAEVTALTKPPSVYCHSRHEYIKLLSRLFSLNMISFTDVPLAVNGAFGVNKDEDSIRLIIDATAVNLLMVPPPSIQLPNPGHLANLQTSSPFYVSKLDLSNYYHQIRMPTSLQQYFCLPGISRKELESIEPKWIVGDKGRLYPMLSTLPMDGVTVFT